MIPNYYEFQNAAKILSGKFSLENIPTELNSLGAKKVLILSDKTLEKIGTMQIVIDAISNKNIQIAGSYTNIPPDSSIEIINEIVKKYNELKCDSIIAIGGGSVIDTAKGVRMVLSQGVDDILKLSGCETIKYGKHIPFIAIPTTSGTGAEVTLVAVILDKLRNIKTEFISYYLVPDVAVLDSRMTSSLPPRITASTGMDALCHAIEGYTCLQKNPLSDAYATSAIKIISESLLATVKNGKDEKLRLEMSNASLMAGIAFSNSMVGLIHAIGHALGGVCHVPHGDAMSILMPHCMRYNMDKLKDEYAELLLYIAGPEVYANTKKEERANKTIEYIDRLREDLNKLSGLPLSLNEVGVRKEDFMQVAKIALNDGAMIVNPKQVDCYDIIEILNKAF